jgi:hypothetical protein
MKKHLQLLLITACITSGTIAQTVYSNKSDVFASKIFNFYGYDYTMLKLADGSRMGQDFKKFFPSLSKILLGEYNQKEFEIMFRKGKYNIPFNTIPTETENEKINNGKFVTNDPHKISADLLSSMIKKYELPEKQGIGSVIIFECFNREANTVSAYMVFFDIATKTIIYSKDVDSHDGNGYQYMGDWKKASIKAVKRLLNSCVDDFDEYRKEQKKLSK